MCPHIRSVYSWGARLFVGIRFVPLSHFVWAVWGLYQARSSDIEFDYKVSAVQMLTRPKPSNQFVCSLQEYAVQRLSAYKTTKERLLEKQL